MTATLITVGIACLLAAIIGGGFKGLGVEIPILHSRSRQIMLATAGVVLLVSEAARYYVEKHNPEIEVASGLKSYDASSFSDALSHFKIAAQFGNKEAQYHYGEMLYHGEGCVSDEREGIRRIRKAAEGGFAPAEAALANFYYLGGHGFDKDVVQARVWADRSASQSDPWGLAMVALLEGDAAKAFTPMYESAKQGYAPAQYWLGLWFREQFLKNRSASDFGNSGYWLARAAEQGHADAEVSLAQNLFSMSEASPTSGTNMANLKDSYAWVCRALVLRNDLFPLSEQVRDQATALKGKIEAVLPPAVQMQVSSSTMSWQPTLRQPYRHRHE